MATRGSPGTCSPRRWAAGCRWGGTCRRTGPRTHGFRRVHHAPDCRVLVISAPSNPAAFRAPSPARPRKGPKAAAGWPSPSSTPRATPPAGSTAARTPAWSAASTRAGRSPEATWPGYPGRPRTRAPPRSFSALGLPPRVSSRGRSPPRRSSPDTRPSPPPPAPLPGRRRWTWWGLRRPGPSGQPRSGTNYHATAQAMLHHAIERKVLPMDALLGSHAPKGAKPNRHAMTDEKAAFLERLQPNDARHVERILIHAHGSAVFAFCMQLLSLKRCEPQRQPQTSRIRYTAPGR